MLKTKPRRPRVTRQDIEKARETVAQAMPHHHRPERIDHNWGKDFWMKDIYFDPYGYA